MKKIETKTEKTEEKLACLRKKRPLTFFVRGFRERPGMFISFRHLDPDIHLAKYGGNIKAITNALQRLARKMAKEQHKEQVILQA